jgi:hypothetical protein
VTASLITPPPSPAEAAAIVVAIEHFIADTSSQAAPAAVPANAWMLNARLEAVGIELEAIPLAGANSAWELQTS